MRLIIALFLILLSLPANDATRRDIIEMILSNISIKKDMFIWCDNTSLQNELKKSSLLRVVDKKEHATLLIIESKGSIDKSCSNKPVFALEYNILKEIPQSFGAMYWKKARPNIVFIAPRVSSMGIDVSPKLSSYIEDSIW